jgi:hypothetical protein
MFFELFTITRANHPVGCKIGMIDVDEENYHTINNYALKSITYVGD